MEKVTESGIQELHISVRNLVEFILRGGDIDNRSSRMVQEAMLEGGKIHRKIQNSMGSSYTAEVPLKIERIEESYVLVVEGRADGIAFGEFVADEPAKQIEEQRLLEKQKDEMQIGEQLWYIDEIKGVYRNLASMEQPVYVHKAQAMCYAYIYALQNHLDRIGVQMTYCNLDTEDIRYFREIWEWEDLYDWFEHLIAEYKKWADWQIAWRQKRQESIAQLEFPYPYREGQRKLVADVYRTIIRRKTLFIQAPTGVGKTISTIFPAVKAVGETGRPHFLFDGKDDHGHGCERNIPDFKGTWISGEDYSADSKRKVVHVWGRWHGGVRMQSCELSVCERTL